MRDASTYCGYIRDLAYLLREVGAKAAKEQNGEHSGFHEGRAAAFREVLDWMQHQADAFEIPREEICLSGFEALIDPLDPPPPQPLDADGSDRGGC